MAITLVINHHSLMSENCVSSTFEVSCCYLTSFFETWRYAINKNLCEKYIACDTEIWNWELGEDKNMHDYAETLKRDAQALILGLLKITKKSTLEYFTDEILEIVTTEPPALIDGVEVPLLGCVFLTDGAISLSLKTSKLWQTNSFILEWKTPPSTTSSNNICRNFSTVEHVDEFYNTQLKEQDYTEESLRELLPTVQLTPPFWEWFEILDKDVQSFIIEKAQYCEKNAWMARNRSLYQALVNTKNGLHELRIWPVGKTLRVYTKKVSDTRVIFLGGSDKDGQSDGIDKADSHYSENFS